MHHTSCQLAAAKEKVKGSCCKQWQLAEWRFITWNPVSLLVGPSINKRVELTEPHTTPLSSLSSPPSLDSLERNKTARCCRLLLVVWLCIFSPFNIFAKLIIIAVGRGNL
jgi:hypothetical protein